MSVIEVKEYNNTGITISINYDEGNVDINNLTETVISKILNMLQEEDDKAKNDFSVGTCCFCKGECNPCSQACGRCARKMTFG